MSERLATSANLTARSKVRRDGQLSWPDVRFQRVRADKPALTCDPSAHPDSGFCGGCIIGRTAISLDYPPLDPADCLWQFLDLNHASAETVVDFVETWGFMERLPKRNWQRWQSAPLIDDIRDRAGALRLALDVLVRTANGHLVDMAELTEFWRLGRAFRDYRAVGTRDPAAVSTDSDTRPNDPSPYRKGRNYPTQDQTARWLDDRTRERTDGKGLEYQGRLVASFLESWSQEGKRRPLWEDGRRLISIDVTGVAQLVGLALRRLFVAPELSVFTCGTCSRYFQFEPGDGRRRPQATRRVFCSSECRLMAERASKRMSWAKNGATWRPAAKPRAEKGFGDNGTR